MPVFTNRPVLSKLGDFVSLNDFADGSGNFAGSTQTASTNTTAWNGAIAYCGAKNCGLYVPEPFYNVHLLNINSNSTGGTILDPIRIWSDCSQAGIGLQSIAGTRLICDGVDPTGATWRKSVINVVTPNGSNTGPDLTHQLYGLRLRGIYLDLTGAALTANLNGFFLQRCWRWALEDCGLVNQGTARWAAGVLLDTGERGNLTRVSVSWCAAGIATGNSSSTGQVADITISDSDITNCSSAGIGTAYSINTTVRTTSLLSNAVGISCLGTNLVLEANNFYSGNTLDLQDVSSATAPFGGTWTNAGRSIQDQEFSAPVQILNSNGTVFGPNTWNSTLSIDVNCRNTAFHSQHKLPTGVTDASPDLVCTINVQGSGPPGTSQGLRNQRYADITNSIYYVCTASAIPGAATWQAMTGGGGGGSTPGASTSYSPSIGVSSGSFTVTTSNCRFLHFGKWVFVSINFQLNITSPCQLFQIGMPVAPLSGTTSFQGGLGGAASAAGALVSSQCVIDPFASTIDIGTVTFNGGSVAYLFPNGLSTIEYQGIYEST